MFNEMCLLEEWITRRQKLDLLSLQSHICSIKSSDYFNLKKNKLEETQNKVKVQEARLFKRESVFDKFDKLRNIAVIKNEITSVRMDTHWFRDRFIKSSRTGRLSLNLKHFNSMSSHYCA